MERNIRRAIRASISTDRVPSRATANRQPKGFMPNSCSPAPMIHLPTGGCTTYDAVERYGTAAPGVMIVVLASSGQLIS